MRDSYLLGGNINLRLRLHEQMKHDCFVAKEAYRKLCRDMRDPKYVNITEEEALELYEKYKKENTSFVSVINGLTQTTK